MKSIHEWKHRMLPILHDNLRECQPLPPWLPCSLAALLAAYHQQAAAVCPGSPVPDAQPAGPCETPEVLAVFADAASEDDRNYVWHILRRDDFWGEDLTAIPGFATAVSYHLHGIHAFGLKSYLEQPGHSPVDELLPATLQG